MFGTTKYCHQFLGGRPCSNPDCMYLHSVAEGDTSFTKDEMQSGRTFNAIVQPGRGAANPANDHYQGSTFPPRQYAFMGAGAIPQPMTPTPEAAAAAAAAATTAPSTPVAVTVPPPTNAWKTGGVPPVAAAASRTAAPSEVLSDRAARFRAQRAASALGGEEGSDTPPPAEDDTPTATSSGAGDTQAASASGAHDAPPAAAAPLPPRVVTTIGLLSCASGLFLPPLPQSAQSTGTGAGALGFAVHSVPQSITNRVKTDADLLLPALGDLTAALAELVPGQAAAGSGMGAVGGDMPAMGSFTGGVSRGGDVFPADKSKASSAGRSGSNKSRR